MSKDFNLLKRSASIVAPRLLGCELVINNNSDDIRLKIVETEGYDELDEASHSFRGKTNRNSVMFDTYGHLYVYFTYGMHYCANITVGEIGQGSAVLIRAVEPLSGLKYLRSNRAKVSDNNLTNGPAKLCQALNINLELNGHDLKKEPLKLIIKPALNKEDIVVARRIGISREKDKMLRFYIKNNPFISKI